MKYAVHGVKTFLSSNIILNVFKL